MKSSYEQSCLYLNLYSIKYPRQISAVSDHLAFTSSNPKVVANECGEAIVAIEASRSDILRKLIRDKYTAVALRFSNLGCILQR